MSVVKNMKGYYHQWEARSWDMFPPVLNTGEFRNFPRKAKKRLAGRKITYNRHQKLCCGIYPPQMERRIRKAMSKTSNKSSEFITDLDFD